jgi:16S rRNA processing protein RimM
MFITIGQIVSTHGNRGEVKVMPFTDDPNRFFDLQHVYLVHPQQEASEDPAKRRYVTLEQVRFHKKMVLITFKEVENMNQGEALRNYYLQLPESELQPLPEGRYYIYQLIGLEVYEGETCYGKITEVMQPGSNDVYVVWDAERKSEVLVPALKDVIKKVDIPNGRMEVVLPPGLLD